jgi:pimeloyl-ACP methyl ester carboxylesterase
VLAHGRRLHYLDWGGTGRLPLVLLHGAWTTAHAWDFFSLELREHFHVHAVDLPGHGDSDWSPERDYSRERLATDIAALIDQLDLQSLVLIGHSLGGSVATLCSAELGSRLKGLVLVDSTLLPPPPSSQPNPIAQFVNGRDTFESMEAFAQHAAGFNRRRDPQRLMVSLRWNARQLEDGNWTWKYDPALRQRASWRTSDYDRLWSALDTAPCPVLFVRATEHSHLTAEAAERLRAIPHVRMVEVANSAHNVMGDNPLAFNRAVAEWLSTAVVA